MSDAGRGQSVEKSARRYIPNNVEDHAGALVEFAHQMEQQCAASLRERQIAEFIENDQVDLHEPVGDLARLAVSFLLFQRVDELDSGEEPDSEAMVSDGLHADGGGEMISYRPSTAMASGRDESIG